MNRKVCVLFFIIFFICALNADYAQKINFDKYNNQAQSVTRLRIASVSVVPGKWEKESNWKQIEKMVTEAALEGGADIVVTPEGALEGYVVNEVIEEKEKDKKSKMRREFLELAEPLDGPYIKKACRLADELNIYFILGFLEKYNKSLYNSAVLIDPDGDIIGKYSKTHFWQGYEVNPDPYKAGDEYPVFETPFGKAGILICYDRQLPEPARILALKGAQVLFFPSYGGFTDKDGWNTVLMRTRAYENRVPVVFCHPKQSLLISENGDIKAMGKENEIVYYEIDTDPEKYKGRFKNRRASTYTPLIEGKDPASLEK